MPTAEQLPGAFDPEAEKDKFLAAAKKRAAKFSRKKAASLDAATRLAYWLFVYGREDEALEACRFVGQTEFAGNFNLWTWVELALALQSRIARRRGSAEESAECLRRIRAAGFRESRLNGSLLEDKLQNVQRAAAAQDKTGERDWGQNALLELCVLIELGGSETWPVEKLEAEFAQTVSRLREILKVA
jgi:hypothetical protein